MRGLLSLGFIREAYMTDTGSGVIGCLYIIPSII